DMQELFLYMELAFTPKFSFFANTPFRFTNPEVNPNNTGWGDMDFGAKWAIISQDLFVTTFQIRGYMPTGEGRVGGTHHWSVEPAVLLNWRLADYLTLEGEFRYWTPIGGTDFAGDILRYGLSLSYGASSAGEMWMCPVAEVIGWTVLDGRAQVATSPESFYIEDAAGTIVMGTLGLRLGFSDQADLYAGYARTFTGHAWFRDQARI